MCPPRLTWVRWPLGLCLLAAPLGSVVWRDCGPERSPSMEAVTPPVPRTPSEAAHREARHWHREAKLKVNARMDALREWDANAMARPVEEECRRQLTAGTRELRAAQDAAQRALALASAPQERRAALLLLARLECDTGHHARELAHAREVVALAPAEIAALKTLQRAAVCNGLSELASWANAASLALPPSRTVGVASAARLPARPLSPAGPRSMIRTDRDGR